MTVRAAWILGLCVACHRAADHGAPPAKPAPAPVPVASAPLADAAPVPVPVPVPVDAAAQTTGATLAAGQRAHPILIAADATGAYWVEQGDDAFSIFHIAPGGSAQLVAKRDGRASALAADGQSAYVLADGANGFDLFRVHDGRAEPLATDIGAEQLAVDASGIYLGTSGGSILKLVPGKGKPRALAGSPEFSFISKLAIDDASVYFSNELDDTPKRIYRVGKTGGDVYQVAGENVGSWGVSAKFIYYDDGSVMWQVDKRGQSWQHPTGGVTAKPVLVRAGTVLAVTRDALVFSDLGHVGVHTLAPVGEIETPLVLAGDITGVAFAAGTLWLARDSDVLYWQRK